MKEKLGKALRASRLCQVNPSKARSCKPRPSNVELGFEQRCKTKKGETLQNYRCYWTNCKRALVILAKLHHFNLQKRA